VSYGFGLMIESLVAVLLLVTIVYCMLLNNRLTRLKADEQSLKATIAELITATEMAERAVAGLKITARDAEATLGERLKSAERCCAELGRQVSAGDGLINRLIRAVAAGRGVGETASALPMPVSAAPDPKAVAAAARSFAERLRERMGAIAA
jgi:hypothetical protein